MRSKLAKSLDEHVEIMSGLLAFQGEDCPSDIPWRPDIDNSDYNTPTLVAQTKLTSRIFQNISRLWSAVLFCKDFRSVIRL